MSFPSSDAEKRIEEIKKRYPEARSAVMPALYIAQEELGHITEEAIAWVSERIGLAPSRVQEVATFYTMYYKKPVGLYHIQVCRTIACALCGSAGLSEFLSKRLAVKPGEVTPDGVWSWEEVECLGSCGTGPMAQINDVYFERLNTERLSSILDRIERERPDLRLSTIKDQLGNGLDGCPKSEVV